MNTIFTDLRYALRGLVKRKGFAGIAVLTLALGIGATTATFTVVDAVLLRKLPVAHPEEAITQVVAIAVKEALSLCPLDCIEPGVVTEQRIGSCFQQQSEQSNLIGHYGED
jgi:hypothetical protein